MPPDAAGMRRRYRWRLWTVTLLVVLAAGCARSELD